MKSNLKEDIESVKEILHMYPLDLESFERVLADRAEVEEENEMLFVLVETAIDVLKSIDRAHPDARETARNAISKIESALRQFDAELVAG